MGQIDVVRSLSNLLNHHILKVLLIAPQINRLGPHMAGGEEFSREREVNRERGSLELNPVNEASCENIEDPDGLIKGGAEELLGVRLAEANVGDLVPTDLWELSHLLQIIPHVQNYQREV
jgi:hypothetical protein